MAIWNKCAILAVIIYLAIADIPQIVIDGIEPDAGLMSGGTRVMVRGGPFRGKEKEFKRPKCKFGSSGRVVNATYVRCTTAPPGPGNKEPEMEEKDDVCLQCDNSPRGERPEIIPFTVSLTGDFTDVSNSIHYRYYPDPKINAIYPRYGKKNGGTYVQIWGENFLNFDQYLRCSFGTKETPAYFVDEHYLYCYSPTSEVVNSPQPLSITMNDQQFSNKIDYWYYEQAHIYMLDPNRGPDTGGVHVLLKGNNFDPFSQYNINNYNDTFCRFGPLGTVPVQVINSTKVICVAPPSFVLREVVVEVTLNNQEWTRDGNIFYYYRPPFVYDIEPLMGPVEGGTEVKIHGSNFQDTGKIRCKFGENTVPGKYINANNIICSSPPTEKPGYVPLQVAVHDEDFSSPELVKYLYYDTPIINRIEPFCGPERGYTQLTIYGKNFIDPGFDMVFCVFNKTILMNATVFEPDRIVCSTPPVLNRFGINENNVQLYDVEITLNKKDLNGPAKRFHYYKEVTLKTVSPPGGPLSGGTVVNLEGKGFKPICPCNVTSRFATFQIRTINYTNTNVFVKSPAATLPDDVVVSHGINGQQYNPDSKINSKDPENTYTYYSDPIVTSYQPRTGPSSGNTLIKFVGYGFRPYQNNDGQKLDKPVWLRMRKYGGTAYSNSTQAEYVDDNNIHWRTPPGEPDTNYIIELSLNGQDYIPIIPVNAKYSFTYFLEPHVISLDPPYGYLKTKKEIMLSVKGTSFKCPNNNCNDLACRFGNPAESITTKGALVSSTEIQCLVPKYNKPDVVPVEITLNGDYYTNDKKEFGFYDPCVLKVTPKMVSKKGNSTITIFGYGFVNTTGTHLKTKYGYIEKPLSCNGKSCIVMSKYIDKNHIEAVTYPHKDVVYEESGSSIRNHEFPVEISVYNDDFTNNNVTIFYFSEPEYGDPHPNAAPANGGETITVPTNFKTPATNPDNPENDESLFRDYGNATCRFTSITGQVVVTKGTFGHYPIREADNYNSIYCKSPKWNLPESVDEEDVILDLSVNGGSDYSGGKKFKITKKLGLYRIYPTCGPTYGGTKMTVVGTGMKKHSNLQLKWGVLTSEQVDTSNTEFIIYSNITQFSKDPFENEVISMNEDMKMSFKDKSKYEILNSISPKLINWDKTHGGQVYLQLGRTQELKVQSSQSYYLHEFPDSMMEYYYYKQPKMKDMKPKAGLTKGGTGVVIRGCWFKYKPEYGVIPYAKFGNLITRCQFESTVRIICKTPPSNDTDTLLPVGISLNGIDFTYNNMYYHYFYPPEIKDISPRSGPDSGGSRVRLIGEKFSNLSSGTDFMCRFTPLDLSSPPKYIPAVYENASSIICRTPGGWGSGSRVKIAVTFNGEDYTESDIPFYFFSVNSAYPRSGPSDGTAGILHVYGSGFENNNFVTCSFDGTKYKPIEITWNVIKCKIPKAKNGPDFFGTVTLEVSLNGIDSHKFEGGFQYYPQISVSDFYPRTGPANGGGVVKFYGKGFRSDFTLAKPTCRFGEYIGVAEVLSSTEMLCHVPEIEVINQTYTGEAALNGQSFVQTSAQAIFVPYGIYDIDPNSGPTSGGSEIMVSGEGFSKTGKPKCRFGIRGYYAEVEGIVLSSKKMICISPKAVDVPQVAGLPFSVPFSVSFLDEKVNPWTGSRFALKSDEVKPTTGENSFDPWTKSCHIYRYYPNPTVDHIDPKSCKLNIIDVYVYANAKTPFIEPVAPIDARDYETGIKCSFDRFGTTPGVYLNETTIRCVTPVVRDPPSSIREETVNLKVAMNGKDFTASHEKTLFTFIGTKSAFSFWPYIIGIILGVLALIALIMCCSAMFAKPAEPAPLMEDQLQSERGIHRRRDGPSGVKQQQPHTLRDEFGLYRTRGYFEEHPASPDRDSVMPGGRGSYNIRGSAVRASKYSGYQGNKGSNYQI